MTASNRIISPDVAHTLQELGAPVLRKPFNIEYLADVVAEAARRLHVQNEADLGADGGACRP
jgi:hypothetical protein